MEKNGMLSSESQSDFDSTKKAEYYDLEGFCVADENNKEKLKKAERIDELNSAHKTSNTTLS